MIAAYAPLVAPPSAQPPTPNLAPRDVERLADDLVAYHARFAPLFQRSAQRRAALLYLQGQLLDVERKTIEPLAHAVVGGDVQALQQVIGQSPWDADAVLHAHQAYVGETLGDTAEGAFIIDIDGCDVPTQGTESVGVARPWRGRGAGRWASAPTASPAWSSAPPARAATRWWTANSTCPSPGSPRRTRRGAPAAGCRPT